MLRPHDFATHTHFGGTVYTFPATVAAENGVLDGETVCGAATQSVKERKKKEEPGYIRIKNALGAAAAKGVTKSQTQKDTVPE